MGVLLVCALALSTAAAAQAAPRGATGAAADNGAVSQPVYGYADAIRERVFVTSDFDSDKDGKADTIAMDIIRPRATQTQGLKVPVIMDASPYYSTVGRGNESELKADTDNDGRLDKFPLFYDNYFVPRGYAVVQTDMVGTNKSDGCPVTGGTPDNLSAVVAIDWLNGRREGRDASGAPVVADWHNGKTGMIGKSYDGTLANAAAATGVEGLTTIVPISAISNWYFYTRMNGLVTRGSSYPSSLSNTVTDANRRAYCQRTRDAMAAADGDETGDYTAFWKERDYLPNMDNIKASVLVTHGLQDDNVRTNNFSEWWYGLAQRNVPRKLWLLGEGHVDPFDSRRQAWVSTLHRWFDYWLLGMDNGIMDEPMVDIEVAANQWETHANWPLPTTAPVPLWFRPGLAPVTNGTLGLAAAAAGAQTSFTDSSSQQESMMTVAPQVALPNRRVFLSEELKTPLRLSGTPYLQVSASADQTDTNLGALIVDYGNKTQITRTGEGITTSTTESCWGESSATDDACYKEVVKVTSEATDWRVAKGVLDAANRDWLESASPMVAGRFYDFSWDLLPNDYIFPAGHRIGIILVGSYPGFSSTAETNGANITVDLAKSKIMLPLVGGATTAQASGAFAAAAPAPSPQVAQVSLPAPTPAPGAATLPCELRPAALAAMDTTPFCARFGDR
jgi:X-Pro dipeptidyl-peptidase